MNSVALKYDGTDTTIGVVSATTKAADLVRAFETTTASATAS